MKSKEMDSTPTSAIDAELPSCSSLCSSPEQTTKAVVPLSSSLPSKLLRFHAKRSAQVLLHQVESQNQSLDSQFGSDEGLQAGASSGEDYNSQDSCDLFDNNNSLVMPISPPPPRNSPSADNIDEKIDVGMGSSIEGSEESEEDDELKPLAVDNHVLHEVDLRSPSNTQPDSVLEANLEKFHKHHHGSQVYTL